MFFYAAKVGWFILQPSGLLLIVLLSGAVLLATDHQRWGRRLVIASAVLLLVGSLLPLSSWLILPLEERFPRPDLSVPGTHVDGIILLGGMEDSRVSAGRHVHAINEAGERLTETVALARRFPAAKVVFTGGSVDILATPTYGADAAKLMLRDLGIDETGQLLLERKARNTWENAVFTKALVHPKPGERWLLVTSAWHMPRAMGAFREAGFDVEPWPVDYRTASGWDRLRPFEIPSEGLRRLDLVVKEWVGLLIYRLTGRSSALFPGP